MSTRALDSFAELLVEGTEDEVYAETGKIWDDGVSKFFAKTKASDEDLEGLLINFGADEIANAVCRFAVFSLSKGQDADDPSREIGYELVAGLDTGSPEGEATAAGKKAVPALVMAIKDASKAYAKVLQDNPEKLAWVKANASF